MNVKQPRPPADLAAEGKKLWRAIVADAAGQGLEFDARELAWLRTAGKLADRIAQLEVALNDAPLIVKGHAQQPVAQPLLAEWRMTCQLLAQTLARLRVDVVETATGGTVTNNRHRAAALARWYPAGRA
jgi:hypothetical protein